MKPDLPITMEPDWKDAQREAADAPFAWIDDLLAPVPRWALALAAFISTTLLLALAAGYFLHR